MSVNLREIKYCERVSCCGIKLYDHLGLKYYRKSQYCTDNI